MKKEEDMSVVQCVVTLELTWEKVVELQKLMRELDVQDINQLFHRLVPIGQAYLKQKEFEDTYLITSTTR